MRLMVIAVVFLISACSHIVAGISTSSLFNRYDADNNDCLTDQEFSRVFLHMDKYPLDDSLTVQEVYNGWSKDHLNDRSDVPFFFSELDKNHDTHITRDELHMEFKEFDANHDDCVIYQEFSYLWHAKFNF